MPRYFSSIRSSFDSALAEAPVLARLRVQVLGERLGQPIGERLDDDRGVVVVRGFELLDERVDAEAGGHRERADVVGDAAVDRRDEVGERAIRLVVGDHFLLPQHRESRRDLLRPSRLRSPSTARCRRRRCSPARSRRRRGRGSACRRRSASAASARGRRDPRRRADLSDRRGSAGSGPSAPTPRRRTSSR